MNDKPKKKANQLKNQEIAERLFPTEVINKAKEVANEKEKRHGKPQSQD